MKKAKKKKEEEKSDSVSAPKIRLLNVRIVDDGAQEVWKPMTLEFEHPLSRLDTAAFHMEVKVDTVWKPADTQPVPIPADTLSPADTSLIIPGATRRPTV